MPIIEVKHLTKEYDLGAVTGIKDSLRHTLAKIQGKDTWQRERFKALDDVNFTIEEGEVVGIIGHNGAGKSTLLKHLANITKPTNGEVIIRGSIAPLIEVGAGVNPELTGRENIFLNGAILGIPKKVIQSKLDEIIDFSELEQFIDTPVKRYSSGMTVKLGFSIATSLDADILIIDEVLAVGDLAFQRKCFDKMEHMINHQGKTVLLVSHNIRQVERLCSRVIMIDNGKILADGNSTKVCNLFFNQSNEQIKANVKNSASKNLNKTEDLDFKSVEIFNNKHDSTDSIECLSKMNIEISFNALKPLKNICFLIGIHTPDFVFLTATNSIDETHDYLPGEHRVAMTINSMALLPGVYSIRVWIGTPEGKVSFDADNLKSFTITSEDHLLTRQQEMGLFHLDANWQFESTSNTTNNDITS
jgi:ABC-type polysaccharide/polyol phosphate transport system ATPase subunit